MVIITIQHRVEIDRCIAEEIKELNNEHNILTLYSCCGHDTGDYGYIVVHEFDESKMVELGYMRRGCFETDASGHTVRLNTFQAKTMCKCRE